MYLDFKLKGNFHLVLRYRRKWKKFNKKQLNNEFLNGFTIEKKCIKRFHTIPFKRNFKSFKFGL